MKNYKNKTSFNNKTGIHLMIFFNVCGKSFIIRCYTLFFNMASNWF